MLIAIWAHDNHHLIGQDGHLPWHLPEDMKFFKQQTVGHTVVMGRKTFNSMNNKPLPNRECFIMTTQDLTSHQDHVHYVQDKKQVLELAAKEDIFVIGGKQVYLLFWPDLQELRVTTIKASFSGDTYFEPDMSDFELYRTIKGTVDEKNKYPHDFQFWKRKKSIL